jgi:glycosyltransferase involved in cell wall biosynthesis
MKIRTATELETTQGAHKFRNLLNTELRNLGHDLSNWSSKEPFDVVLSRGPLPKTNLDHAKSIGAKVIIQYGGWDWSPESNRALSHSMNHADGIIYNSKFGMDFVHSHGITPDCPEIVIHNGGKRLKKATLENPIFLVACETYNMPSKIRVLKDAIGAVEKLKKLIAGPKLWVAGRAPQLEGVDRYLGRIADQSKLEEERSKAAVLIHTVENDNCPNTVVETLGQGIPVICHAKSGTPEIVKWYGRAINEPNPDKIAFECHAMWSCAPAWQSEWLKTFDGTLRIDRIAKEYEDFLEEILNVRTLAHCSSRNGDREPHRHSHDR